MGVAGPLGSLLPEGVARGSTVLVGSVGLGLALMAALQAVEGWAAGVGWGPLGMVAARELGVDWDRLVTVAVPSPASWATAVSAALDAFDVVAVAAADQPAGEARRLSSRARERGAVLVVIDLPAVLSRSGNGWRGAADARLRVVEGVWRGVGEGHGYLRSRRVTVEATGRGRLVQARRAELWVPGPGGGVWAGGAVEAPVEIPAAGAGADKRAAS